MKTINFNELKKTLKSSSPLMISYFLLCGICLLLAPIWNMMH